jgi:undecaprenyl-diphosphatase
MGLFEALLLGTIQGLTEFVPVSSTAHLYITQALLGIRNDEIALSFDVVLHLGTAAALLLVFWREIRALLEEALLWSAGRPARDAAARALILPLAIGTVPGVLAGLFVLKRIEGIRTLGLIGLSMMAACAYFLFSESRRPNPESGERDLSRLSLADALWIGVAQAAAGLMAGFSRSGLTIATGRLRGLGRGPAARFSFLLALPIILGAGAKALLDWRKSREPSVGAGVLAAGFLASAVVGFAAVRFLLRYLKTHTLRPFAFYLGALGTVLLSVSLARRLPLLGEGSVPAPASSDLSRSEGDPWPVGDRLTRRPEVRRISGGRRVEVLGAARGLRHGQLQARRAQDLVLAPPRR